MWRCTASRTLVYRTDVDLYADVGHSQHVLQLADYGIAGLEVATVTWLDPVWDMCMLASLHTCFLTYMLACLHCQWLHLSRSCLQPSGVQSQQLLLTPVQGPPCVLQLHGLTRATNTLATCLAALQAQLDGAQVRKGLSSISTTHLCCLALSLRYVCSMRQPRPPLLACTLGKPGGWKQRLWTCSSLISCSTLASN